MRIYGIFLICIFGIGCRALLTQHTFIDEQTYVRIDAPVTVTKYGGGETVYTIPDRNFVRKIRILGEGAVQNIEIWARDDRQNWKPVRQINRKSASPLNFPIEISMHHLPLTFRTDAIRIVERETTKTIFTDQTRQIPKGKIDTVEFWTTVSKSQ